MPNQYFITGGAGFLGRALAARLPDDHITVYSRDQAKHAAMERRYRNVHCIQGDIQDYERLRLAMAGHQIVIHAAASKYVDRAEGDALGTVATNINGSVNVAMAAIDARVETAICISTDKAAGPVNTYGMTKALMERTWQQFANMGETTFVAVRYGNVVSSTGSVVPLFRQQMLDTGAIQITNPAMTRFWLGIEEAVNLVMMALVNHQEADGGVIIPSVYSGSLQLVAEAVWMRYQADLRLSANTPVINVIGERPGEKIHERLLTTQELQRAEWFENAGDNAVILWPPDERSSVPLINEHPDAQPWDSEHCTSGFTAALFNDYIDQAEKYEAKVYG